MATEPKWPTTPWYIERGGFGGDGSYFIKSGFRLRRAGFSDKSDRTIVIVSDEEHRYSHSGDSTTVTTVPVRDAEAIAHLLATAPELHSALADMLRIIDAMRISTGLGKGQAARVEKAKAALHKAEGKSVPSPTPNTEEA